MPRPKHLTRKEITEDRIRLLLLETWEWVIEYRNFLLGGLAGLLLLGVGYWGFDALRERQMAAAQQELAAALKIFNTPLPGAEAQQQPEVESPYTSEQERDEQALREFRRIARDQGWSSVGELAHFYVAVTQRRLGQWDESLDSFRAVVEQSPNTELANLARNHVAQLALELGRRDQAIEAWNAILDQPSSHVPSAPIMASLAKTYDAGGQEAEALDLYKKLIAENPSIPDAASIEARIALLESQLEPLPGAEPDESATSPSTEETDG